MLCGVGRAAGHARGDRGCFCTSHAGRESRKYRADVPPRLFVRLYPATRPDRHGRIFGAGDRLLGYSGQGSGSSGLCLDRRQDERTRAGLYLSLPAAASRYDRFLDLARDGGGIGAGLCGAWLYRDQVRSGGALYHARRAYAGDDRHLAICRLLQSDPRGGWRQGRSAVRHPRAIHHCRRDPFGERHRALQPALVRRADPARCGRTDGRRSAGRADPCRDRRAADHQGRIRACAAVRGSRDPAACLGPCRWYLGGQEDRRHGRGL